MFLSSVVRTLFLSLFFFSSRSRHTSSFGDWSSDVCSSDLAPSQIQTFHGDGRNLRHAGPYIEAGTARRESRRKGISQCDTQTSAESSFRRPEFITPFVAIDGAQSPVIEARKDLSDRASSSGLHHHRLTRHDHQCRPVV